METDRRKQLEAVMQRMAAGDSAAVWSFADQFQGELRQTVRGHLTAIGRHDLREDNEVVAGVVIDAALLLFGTSSWHPGGALPWVWARLAIRDLVSATAGHRASVIDDERCVDDAPTAVSLCDDIDLDVLAARDPVVHKLRDAIARVGSVRDQRVHVDYRTQQADGDPSPSHTVAVAHGLTPASVRQIDSRIKTKLRSLAAANGEFSELGDLRWLA